MSHRPKSIKREPTNECIRCNWWSKRSCQSVKVDTTAPHGTRFDWWLLYVHRSAHRQRFKSAQRVFVSSHAWAESPTSENIANNSIKIYFHSCNMPGTCSRKVYRTLSLDAEEIHVGVYPFDNISETLSWDECKRFFIRRTLLLTLFIRGRVFIALWGLSGN